MIIEDEIIRYIKENDSLKKFLVIRMYDEYNNFQKYKGDFKQNVDLLKLRGAYENICKTIVSSNFNNYELEKYVDVKRKLLKTNFNSFDIKDDLMVQNTMSLITVLECMLKMPVSFPEKLEFCLNEELNLEDKKVKILKAFN